MRGSKHQRLDQKGHRLRVTRRLVRTLRRRPPFQLKSKHHERVSMPSNPVYANPNDLTNKLVAPLVSDVTDDCRTAPVRGPRSIRNLDARGRCPDEFYTPRVRRPCGAAPRPGPGDAAPGPGRRDPGGSARGGGVLEFRHASQRLAQSRRNPRVCSARASISRSFSRFARILPSACCDVFMGGAVLSSFF